MFSSVGSWQEPAESDGLSCPEPSADNVADGRSSFARGWQHAIVKCEGKSLHWGNCAQVTVQWRAAAKVVQLAPARQQRFGQWHMQALAARSVLSLGSAVTM